jgi:hypothetical protein
MSGRIQGKAIGTLPKVLSLMNFIDHRIKLEKIRKMRDTSRVDNRTNQMNHFIRFMIMNDLCVKTIENFAH